MLTDVGEAAGDISQNPSVGIKIVAKSLMQTTGLGLGVQLADGRVAFSIETSGTMDTTGRVPRVWEAHDIMCPILVCGLLGQQAHA